MNELENVRTPEIIAAEINVIKENVRKTILRGRIEIGERLIEAKSMVPDGKWGTWLAEKVDYSERLAQDVMNVARAYGKHQTKLIGTEIEDEKIEKLSYSQAVALLGIKDEDERAQFINENPVEDMSTRELTEAVKARKAAEEKLEEVENTLKGCEATIDRMKAEQIANENRISDLEGALRDGTESIRQEAEKKEIRVKQLEKQLAEAQSAVASASQRVKDTLMETAKDRDRAKEEIQTLRSELEEAKQKLSEPLEPAVVYEDTQETKEALEALKKELAEAKEAAEKAAAAEKATVAFRMAFEGLKKSGNDVLEHLQGMKRALGQMTDETVKAKYLTACVTVINALTDKIAGEMRK